MKNFFLENGVSNNGWDGKMGIAKSHPPVEICRIYLNFIELDTWMKYTCQTKI